MPSSPSRDSHRSRGSTRLLQQRRLRRMPGQRKRSQLMQILILPSVLLLHILFIAALTSRRTSPYCPTSVGTKAIPYSIFALFRIFHFAGVHSSRRRRHSTSFRNWCWSRQKFSLARSTLWFAWIRSSSSSLARALLARSGMLSSA